MNVREERLYETVEAFYADRGGARSGESDFGVFWYDGVQAWSGSWRVSAVQETGDVYAVKLRDGGRAEREEPIGTVFLLGNLGGPDAGYVKSHAALEGWENVIGSADSLEWAVSRVRLASGMVAAAAEPLPFVSDALAGTSLGELAGRVVLLLEALKPWELHGDAVRSRAAEVTLVLAKLPAGAETVDAALVGDLRDALVSARVHIGGRPWHPSGAEVLAKLEIAISDADRALGAASPPEGPPDAL